MKKLLIILVALNLYANDTKEILFLLKKLQKIQYNYKPIISLYNIKKIEQIHKPVINLKHKNVKKVNKTYILEVIFNNKVKINGKWYKNDDIIDGYKIVIMGNNVFLKNKYKTIILKHKLKVLK